MGLLDQFKRAMGLESRAKSHAGLQHTISFPPAMRTDGTNGNSNGHAPRQVANGTPRSEPRPSEPANSRSQLNGKSLNGTSHIADARASSETQMIQAAGQETSVDLALTSNETAPFEPRPEPPAPVDVVSLQFGLDDGTLYEFEDDEEVAELLEDGNCRRCWVEDRTEVQVPVDSLTGMRICPQCKSTYRAVAAE